MTAAPSKPKPKPRAPVAPLTVDQMRGRHTITVAEYAATLDVSTDAVYEAAGRGELRVLRVGRRVTIPTRPLLVALGYEPEA